MKRFLHFVRRLARVTLVSYSQVLLSGNPRSGFCFLAASFVGHPAVGLAGLVATLSANLVGLFSYRERIRWELGLAGYNAVMLGLAVGYFLPEFWSSMVVALIAGGVSAMITEFLHHRFQRFGLPVLGLPFIVICWLVLGAARGFEPLAGKSGAELITVALPGFPAALLHNLGSVYYSAGMVSGALVLIGLIMASRISAALGVAGAIIGALLSFWRPGSISLGINFVIVPIGLMFFLAPNRWLPVHLLVGSVLTFAVGLGLESWFKALGFPLLILPLTLTFFLYLLLGRNRILGVELVPVLLLHTPESNLRLYRRGIREPLRLPLSGTWYVSQGVNGGETHRGRLSHAWDFMVRDEHGRTFVTPGYLLKDYYTFNLPISAPAAGKVVAVENAVPDNPPAKLNRKQNWGNWVIIEHNLLEYSILAHLRQGSVRVRPGDHVTAGMLIGTCGNSGYSGQPHLHYQLQLAPLLGSDALPARFGNYLVHGPEGEQFVRAGIPAQGETVQPIVVQEAIRDLLTACFNNGTVFQRDPTQSLSPTAHRRPPSARNPGGKRLAVGGQPLPEGRVENEESGISPECQTPQHPTPNTQHLSFDTRPPTPSASPSRPPRRCVITADSWTLRFGSTRVTLKPEPEGIAVSQPRLRLTHWGLLARMFQGLEFIPYYSHPGLTFRHKTWRHTFGHRDRLTLTPRSSSLVPRPSPLVMDALILESVHRRVRRRLWLVPGIGIARVDWCDSSGRELESWQAELHTEQAR